MSALDLLSTDLMLAAPCGCSMRRESSFDADRGWSYGKTVPEWCSLHKQASGLLEALQAIGDFKADTSQDEAEREAAYDDAKACLECIRLRRLKWPPSGLCNDHYCRVSRAEDRIKDIQAHQHYSMRHLAWGAIAAAQPAPVTVQAK